MYFHLFSLFSISNSLTRKQKRYTYTSLCFDMAKMEMSDRSAIQYPMFTFFLSFFFSDVVKLNLIIIDRVPLLNHFGGEFWSRPSPSVPRKQTWVGRGNWLLGVGGIVFWVEGEGKWERWRRDGTSRRRCAKSRRRNRRIGKTDDIKDGDGDDNNWQLYLARREEVETGEK